MSSSLKTCTSLCLAHPHSHVTGAQRWRRKLSAQWFALLQLCRGSQRVSPSQLRAALPACVTPEKGGKGDRPQFPFPSPLLPFSSFRSQHTELKRITENKIRQTCLRRGEKTIDRLSEQPRNIPKPLNFHSKYVLCPLDRISLIVFTQIGILLLDIN